MIKPIDNKLKALGVFCGASSGNDPLYAQKAASFAVAMAQNNIQLIYGAGNVGIMKIIADKMISLGGTVTGVITQHLVNVELAHDQIDEVVIVDTMSERKTIIIERADAFVALPGGIGTFDELTEVISLNQLGYIRKPVGLLNINGYFDPFIKLIDHGVYQGFIKEKHRNIFIDDDDEIKLLQKLNDFVSVETKGWLENFKDNNK